MFGKKTKKIKTRKDIIINKNNPCRFDLNLKL